MRTALKITFFTALLVVIISPISLYAATPNLNLSNLGGGRVRITIDNADSNQSVRLYYYPNNSSSSNYVDTIGTTDSGGYLNITINSDNYNIQAGDDVYVTVNGNSSSRESWPTNGNNNNNCYYNNCYYNGNLSFSQTNVGLNPGASQQVTIYGGSGSFYLSSNTVPSAASAYISGNTLYINAGSGGNTNLTVCSNNNNQCGTVYVDVFGAGGYTYSYNPYTGNPYTGSTYPYNYTYPYGSPSSGVYLSQVPATGVNISLKLILFFVGLLLWSAFSAFMILEWRRNEALLKEFSL